MSLSLADTQRLAHLAEAHWHRSAFSLEGSLSAPVTPEELFQLTVQCERRRLYRGNELVGEGELQPRPEDGSFEGFCARWAKMGGSSPFALIGNDLHQSPDLFTGICRMLAPIIQAVGLPTGRLEISLFAGTYDKTPFGVHTDDADVLYFPLIGKKTMRVWTNESNESTKDWMGMLDYQSVVDRSELVSASPGGAVYWPAHSWHVAEGELGSLRVAWGVGFYTAWPSQVIGRLAGSVAEQLEFSCARSQTQRRKAAPGPLAGSLSNYEASVPDWLSAYSSDLRKLVDPGQVEQAVHEVWMQRLSAYGFDPVPALRRGLSLRKDSSIVTDPTFPLLWLRGSSDDLVVASRGHRHRLPYDEAIVEQLQRLNRAEPVAVGELIEPVRSREASGSSAASELLDLLYWSTRTRGVEVLPEH